MHSFEQVLEGIKYSVFFFSTFTGHFHPFTPYKPIDLDEVYNPQRKAYYLAWYVEDESNAGPEKNKLKKSSPKLRYLEKFWIRFSDFSVPDDRETKQGTYYFSTIRSSSGVRIGSRIEAEASIVKGEFYMYRVGENGALIGSWLIRRGLMDKYSYKYKANGALEDVKIEVLELPKD